MFLIINVQSLPFTTDSKFGVGVKVFGYLGFGLLAPFLAGQLALVRGGRTLGGVSSFIHILRNQSLTHSLTHSCNSPRSKLRSIALTLQ